MRVLFIVIGLAGVWFYFKIYKTEKNDQLRFVSSKVVEHSDKAVKVVVKPAIAMIANVKEEPQFDFYTILPKESVSISQKQPDQKNSVKYFLQVAAVKNILDATRRKEELILLGFEASIKEIRVVIGPYFSEAKVKNDQLQLRVNNVQSIVIKL